MDDAIAQIEQALSLAKSLNKAAQTANNHNTDEETQRGRLKEALKDLKEAGLIQTAPAGIATATQQSQLHTANENIHLISGNHTDITAGQKPDRPCGREPQPVCAKQRHQDAGQPG